MFTIRPAVAADLPSIFAIYDHHVLYGTATFETVVKTPAEREAWFDAHAPKKHPAIVAVEPDASGREVLLGWAGASPWSPRQAYARIAENSVYIDDKHHGRGIGRALIKDLITRAKRDTAIRVFIARIAIPNPASVKLHENLGFKTIGTMRRCGEKFGQILDVVLMDLHMDQA